MKKKPGKKQIIEALVNNNGFMINAAQDLEITRQSLAKYINEDPDLIECVKQTKESLKDIAEGQLLKNIREGKETSLLFYLKTHAKDRGYSQDPSELAAMTFNQLNISVRTEESKIIMDEVIKKLSNDNDEKKINI